MNNIDKAIMYKEGNTLQKRVEDLNKEIKTATKEEKIFIEKDIKKYEYAIKGENKIINALMNSNIPMLILHDLNIAYKDYKAQIDFMIITKRNYYILECKNTYGNILVDSNGNFFRTYVLDVNEFISLIFIALTVIPFDWLRKYLLKIKGYKKGV